MRIFIRHKTLGPGIVLEEDKDNYLVQLRNTNGEIIPDQFVTKNTQIRIIPEDSLGVIFFLEPLRIFNQLKNFDAELVNLTLKELNGEALQKDLKDILEPLLKSEKIEWKVWWKKISQKLKNSKSVQLDKIKKTYVLFNDLDGSLSFLKPNDIKTFTAQDYARYAKILLEHPADLKSKDRNDINELFIRLCQIISESPKDSPEIIGLIALGESISQIISQRTNWDLFIAEWLDNHPLNIMGMRDANIRFLGIKAISRIDWPQKKISLGNYILCEESSEKNRTAASKSLWLACNKNSNLFVQVIFDEIDKFIIPKGLIGEKIFSRIERIAQSIIPLTKDISIENELRSFCNGISNILLKLAFKVARSPFTYAITKSILKIASELISKIKVNVSSQNEWITWLIYIPIFKQCEDYAREKYIHEFNLKEYFVINLSKLIQDKANTGKPNDAEECFQLLSLAIGNDESTSLLKNNFQKDLFRTTESKNWALSHITQEDRVEQAPSKTQDKLVNVIFHPRETEIAQNFSAILLFLKEREIIIDRIYSNYEEVVNYYDHTKIDSVHELKTFFDLLRNYVDTHRRLLKLEYFEDIGEIKEFNNTRHTLIDEKSSPKYVQILIPGIGRRSKDGVFEILQKAIVKSI